MTKEEFVICANALRRYWSWERKMLSDGIDLSCSPTGAFADSILEVVVKGDKDWGLDSLYPLSPNWIVRWCSSDLEDTAFKRGRQYITIADAGALWDFVNEMEELGWPEVIENERWL